MRAHEVDLGCGLIAIGRPWGTTPEVPTEADAMRLLETAYTLGVRFFDTAPSYGLSEKRLGLFLGHLTPEERHGVTVATKFGELWDADTQAGRADHTFDALRRSLDNSLGLLGSIAVLQLHKATTDLLDSEDVGRAFEYARAAGVGAFGVSASDVDTATKALHDERFGFLQLPYNQGSAQFTPVVQEATSFNTQLIINRPLSMGKAVSDTAPVDKERALDDAYHFVLSQDFHGFVLSGTANAIHLRENVESFQRVQAQL